MSKEKRMRQATPKWLGVAVQALLFLERDGQMCASGDIAACIGSEVTLVRRVLARLVQAGLITAKEGRVGGYCLTRSCKEITLADVYRAVEIYEPICPGMIPPSPNTYCAGVTSALTNIIQESEQQMLKSWEQHTLASLAVYCED